jgi:cystathionine beta-lyase/cystathionine gamma-synthase
MERHNSNALAVARFLESHPAVDRVHYPGLESHPNHETAKAHFDGFGGMVAAEMAGGEKIASRIVDNTRLFMHAGSLGGVESLISRPAGTSHLGLTDKQLEAAGISKGLIRLSVGIEHSDDLIADLEQAFAMSKSG